MGKTRSLPQQPSPAAHRAASRLKQNSTFANKFNSIMPNIDYLNKTKLIMFMSEPHIVNRINLFYYNFHHNDEFLTK